MMLNEVYKHWLDGMDWNTKSQGFDIKPIMGSFVLENEKVLLVW